MDGISLPVSNKVPGYEVTGHLRGYVGYVWLCVVMCGYEWLCVVMCGCVWLCVVVCGYDMRYALCSMQYAVCSMQYAVCALCVTYTALHVHTSTRINVYGVSVPHCICASLPLCLTASLPLCLSTSTVYGLRSTVYGGTWASTNSPTL
jgi:hypothetical protein